MVACVGHAFSAPQSVSGDNSVGSAPNCARSTPFSCKAAPVENLPVGACAYLRQCLTGRNIGDQTIEKVTNCRAPVLSDASKLGKAAVVDTYVDVVDGPPSHATFLFVRDGAGWCLADRLFDPEWTHGGYCRTRHTLRWSPASTGAAAILSTVSERICHMPLDKGELASGQSDIAMSQCRRARYRIDANALTMLSTESSEGACLSKPSRSR